jgi:putative hydrolase of the HAD superfamily
MPRFQMLAFDADDTLWHNERLYVEAQAQFRQIMSQYYDPTRVEDRLFQTESRNMDHFGYGIKAFTLSMIETAIELTGGRIPGSEIQKIVEIAKHMLNADVQLLTGVAQTIPLLAANYPLMIITKGDLLDQERKINKSGLKEYFQKVEIVSNKSTRGYKEILERHHIDPGHLLMVGNSLKSDILPVLELGAQGVYIPYETTCCMKWPMPLKATMAFSLGNFGQLPELIESWKKSDQ